MCSCLPAAETFACAGLPSATVCLLYCTVWKNNAVRRSKYADNAAVLLRKGTPFLLLQEELDMLLKMYSMLTNAVIKIKLPTICRVVKFFINGNQDY